MSTNEFEELAEKSRKRSTRGKKKSEEDEKEREEETFDVGGEKKRRKEKEEKKDATDDDAQTDEEERNPHVVFWTDAVRYESERYLTLVESELKQARMWTRYRSIRNGGGDGEGTPGNRRNLKDSRSWILRRQSSEKAMKLRHTVPRQAGDGGNAKKTYQEPVGAAKKEEGRSEHENGRENEEKVEGGDCTGRRGGGD